MRFINLSCVVLCCVRLHQTNKESAALILKLQQQVATFEADHSKQESGGKAGKKKKKKGRGRSYSSSASYAQEEFDSSDVDVLIEQYSSNTSQAIMTSSRNASSASHHDFSHTDGGYAAGMRNSSSSNGLHGDSTSHSGILEYGTLNDYDELGGYTAGSMTMMTDDGGRKGSGHLTRDISEDEDDQDGHGSASGREHDSWRDGNHTSNSHSSLRRSNNDLHTSKEQQVLASSAIRTQTIDPPSSMPVYDPLKYEDQRSSPRHHASSTSTGTGGRSSGDRDSSGGRGGERQVGGLAESVNSFATAATSAGPHKEINLRQSIKAEGAPRSNSSSNSSSSPKRMTETTPEGVKVTKYSNGTVKKIYPSGQQEVIFLNGDTKMTHSTGTVVYYYSNAQTTHTTYADGSEVYEFPNNQVCRQNSLT
jgi:hypothetical protein